jgi:hypothetical protein
MDQENIRAGRVSDSRRFRVSMLFHAFRKLNLQMTWFKVLPTWPRKTSDIREKVRRLYCTMSFYRRYMRFSDYEKLLSTPWLNTYDKVYLSKYWTRTKLRKSYDSVTDQVKSCFFPTYRLTFLLSCYTWRSRYSDGNGLDDRGVGVRVPVRSRIFISPSRRDRLWSLPSLLFNGYRGLFPPG